jgi:predicted RNase H-like nuclease (RuvC/YqgF family)
MESEAPISPNMQELRAVVSEYRDELNKAGKMDDAIQRIDRGFEKQDQRVDRVIEKLDAMNGEVSKLRSEVQALVRVGESLTTIGAWAMRWTPYIIAALAGANLIDLRALVAALVSHAQP